MKTKRKPAVRRQDRKLRLLDYFQPPTGVALVVLGVAALLLYLNSLPGRFVFDDTVIVQGNRSIQGLDPEHLGSIFGSHYWTAVESKGGLYRPLVMLSYAVDYAFAGGDPQMFHLTNVVIHAANGILVFLLLEMLFARRALSFLTALLFVMHPIRTEAVASIVGRAESLATLFLLLGWLAYVRGLKTSNPRLYWGAAALFLAATFSKESAYSWLALLPVTDWLVQTGSLRRRFPLAATIMRYLPFCFALALSLGIRSWVLGGLAPLYINASSNPVAHVDSWSRFLTATHVFGRYFGLLLFPLNLSADYSFNQIPVITTILSWRALLPVALLLVLLVLLVMAARRQPILFFAGVLFFVCFVLVSNWIRPIGTIMGERLMYLPGLGFNCAVAFLLTQGLGQERWRGMTALAAVLLLAGYGFRTIDRNVDWRDHYALFKSAARTSPDSTLVQANYALVLLNEKGDASSAIEHARAAIRISPENPSPYLTLGQACHRTGDLQCAADALAAVVRLAPRTSGGVAALRELAAVHESLGHTSEAAADHQTLLEWRRKD